MAMCEEGRMFTRWINPTLIILLLTLQLIYRPTSAQCTGGGLFCKPDSNCYLIYSQDGGEYRYTKAADMGQVSSDECYTITFAEQTSPESCSGTHMECTHRGGKIASITDNDNDLMNTLLSISFRRSEIKFNVLLQNTANGDYQCSYVTIEDGWFWNSDYVKQKPTNESSTVNSILCEQIVLTSTITSNGDSTTSAFGATNRPTIISEINSSPPQPNKNTGKTQEMSTSTLIIIVVVASVAVLLVFVAVVYFKIITKKNNEGAQVKMATVTNTHGYSNPDDYSIQHGEGNITRDTATGTYTYAMTEPEFVTSQRELPDMIDRNYEPLLEDRNSGQPIELINDKPMYANIEIDAVVETTERVTNMASGEYDKINRVCAAVSRGHGDTYNSLNEDVDDQQHYDGLRRFNDPTVGLALSPSNQYATLDHSI